MNSFLSKGNRRVLFQNNYVELSIKNGPKIRIPITSLQSNAMIVNTRSNTKRRMIPQNETTKQKARINTNLIHNRFHRSDGAIATIRAHDLWDDVQVVDGIVTLYTSCKIMTILAHARGKGRNAITRKLLEEI